jgi:hypothetical protein
MRLSSLGKKAAVSAVALTVASATVCLAGNEKQPNGHKSAHSGKPYYHDTVGNSDKNIQWHRTEGGNP